MATITPSRADSVESLLSFEKSIETSVESQIMRVRGEREECLRSFEDRSFELSVEMRFEEERELLDISDEGNIFVVENVTSEQEQTVELQVDVEGTARLSERSNQVEKLSAVLMNSLSVANCAFIFQVACNCEQEHLRIAAHDVICRNFFMVTETCPSFLNLTLEELSLFVFSDFVKATEEQVFHAILRWIKSDLLHRQSLISQLLPAIRIKRCSQKFLQESMAQILVQNEVSFLAAAQEMFKWLTSSGLCKDHAAREVSSRGGERHVLFVMGGLDSVHTVETLDAAHDSWVSHKVLQAPGNWTWICSVGHKILVLEVDNRRFRSFDVTTRTWTQLQSPPCYSFGSSGTSFHHHVYLMGGEEPHSTRCDRYDARTNKWEEMAPMIKGRVWAASAFHAGKLYSSGGLSAECVLSSLEVLGMETNGHWTRRPSMRTARTNHSLVSCGRFLWAIGGWDGSAYLSVVEKYDVEARQWSRVRDLPTPRGEHYASVLCGKIYVIGGETRGYTNVPLVEVYDEAQDQWTSGSSLRDGRRWHGCAVVRFLPDVVADQYVVPYQ